jgi:hypothetical protein
VGQTEESVSRVNDIYALVLTLIELGLALVHGGTWWGDNCNKHGIGLPCSDVPTLMEAICNKNKYYEGRYLEKNKLLKVGYEWFKHWAASKDRLSLCEQRSKLQELIQMYFPRLDLTSSDVEVCENGKDYRDGK